MQLVVRLAAELALHFLVVQVTLLGNGMGLEAVSQLVSAFLVAKLVLAKLAVALAKLVAETLALPKLLVPETLLVPVAELVAVAKPLVVPEQQQRDIVVPHLLRH